jgi:cupredoxin-like protein
LRILRISLIMRPFYLLLIHGLLLPAVGLPRLVGAQEITSELRFEKHHFAPLTLTVPAGRPLLVKVINASDETIEFESFRLHREKVVEPGQTITVRLPSLSPGSYDFYDDFHQDVAEGSIVAADSGGRDSAVDDRR